MNYAVHLTVAAVICRDNRYLLVREQVADLLVYNQPAGHVEANEQLQAAILREAREETGFDIHLDGIIGISSYHSAAAGVTYYRISFSAQLASDEPNHPIDPEILDTRWLTYDEIRDESRLRSPMVLNDIERHRRGEIYPLHMLNEFPSEAS